LGVSLALNTMMLQAFIDDSKSEGVPPFFVLAGYIGRADMWAKFSTEWQRALDMRPRIAYFKFREALRGEGEFNGASEGLRMERARLMRNIIEQFEPCEFSFGFRLDEYEKAFSILPAGTYNNPYYFAAFQLVMRITKNIDHFGGSLNDRLDVVFDNQAMEQARMVAGWEKIGRSLKDDERFRELPPLVANLMRSTPAFRDDKVVLALQAADMHATWSGQYIEAHRDGRAASPMPGFKRQLRGLSVVATRQTLDNLAETMLAGQA
jgi:hypothetical protein